MSAQEMGGREWPRISTKKLLYAPFALTIGTVAVLWQADMGNMVHPALFTTLFWVQFSTLLYSGGVIASRIEQRRIIFDSPLFWRYILTTIYSISPLLFNVLVYIFLYRKAPDPFSLYVAGLLCIFGGLTGILITKEIPEGEVTREYFEKLWSEALQVVWPYTFAFVLMLTASPFVAQALEKLMYIRSLSAVVWVGAVGFITLIVLPMSNLSEIRREMRRRRWL